MKIRLTGTPEELAAVRALLGQVLDVREASEPYRNRGDSQLFRMYVDADLRPDTGLDSGHGPRH